MLRESIKLMKGLRLVNKSLGTNGAKIDTWVDQYIDEYKMMDKPIAVLTPWSISPRLVERYEIQGNNFSPTNSEEKLFRKEIPFITSLFQENGFKLNWWLYFSRSYIKETRLSIELEIKYSTMISSLQNKYSTPIDIINWEDDVIGKRYYPNDFLIESNENFKSSVSAELFLQELERRAIKWKENTNFSTAKIVEQTIYKIACEAEEGKILIQNNPFDSSGKFLFIPVGVPEKYNFFSVLVPEFKKRLVFILKPYPWRL